MESHIARFNSSPGDSVSYSQPMQASLGTEHETTLNAKNCLALDLHAMGHFREACRYREQLLAADKRALGNEHSQTISTAQHLFISRWDAGDVLACRQIFLDYFQSFCHRDPHTLSPLDHEIRSRILKHTDWLSG